jgi:hypothetical protein
MLGLAFAVVVMAGWSLVQAWLDRTSPSRIAARAIAAALHRHADTVGPVQVSGAELRVANATLRLVVSEPDADGAGAAMGHFHVLTTVAAAPKSSLDACVIGGGDSPAERLQGVAEAFVGVAFPPLFSRWKGEPMLDSRPFWGDEPWGVPGRRGYVGPVLGRGSVDVAAFKEAPLFAEVPGLPRDGELHLLKAVLWTKDGSWMRTVELDGHGAGVTERRFGPIGPQSEPGMVVRYAVFDRAAPPVSAVGRDRALERLRARESWLFPAGDCPADLIPAVLPAFSFAFTACRGGRLLDCLQECQRGAASFCYMAALETQSADVDPDAVQALYLRSCRLGYASGCTNAAAGRHPKDGPLDECSLRTFAQVCERAGDPWACTMLGGALERGEATSRDPARARTVLAKACSADQEDPACRAAKAILGRLDGQTVP